MYTVQIAVGLRVKGYCKPVSGGCTVRTSASRNGCRRGREDRLPETFACGSRAACEVRKQRILQNARSVVSAKTSKGAECLGELSVFMRSKKFLNEEH